MSLCNAFWEWHLRDQLQLRLKWPQNTTSSPWSPQPITALYALSSFSLAVSQPVSVSVQLSSCPSVWQAPDAPVSHFFCLSLGLTLLSVWCFTLKLRETTEKERGKSRWPVDGLHKQASAFKGGIWTNLLCPLFTVSQLNTVLSEERLKLTSYNLLSKCPSTWIYHLHFHRAKAVIPYCYNCNSLELNV